MASVGVCRSMRTSPYLLSNLVSGLLRPHHALQLDCRRVLLLCRLSLSDGDRAQHFVPLVSGHQHNGTSENLLALTKENAQRMEKLNDAAVRTKSRIDTLKFSGGGGGHRRKVRTWGWLGFRGRALRTDPVANTPGFNELSRAARRRPGGPARHQQRPPPPLRGEVRASQPRHHLLQGGDTAHSEQAGQRQGRFSHAQGCGGVGAC